MSLHACKSSPIIGRVATQYDARNRSRYEALRTVAILAIAHRTVADRLLKVACVMLTTRTTFESGPGGNPDSNNG